VLQAPVSPRRQAALVRPARPAALAEVADWLEPYRRHWSARLDALERHLEENPE
jgi:hypothetical protein